MRCKKHLNDPTSGVGVCATCLREKLLPILAVQSQDQSPPSIIPAEKSATSLNHASWLANLFSGKKSVAVAKGGRRKKVTGKGRGMSPASDSGEGGGRGKGGGDVAGFVFCISPLVSVRLKRREKFKSNSMPNGMGKQRLDTRESFCKNRSRKVADFGRLHRRS